MPAPALTLRSELRCFTCVRFLGDFESHPETHGRGDIHILKPEFELPASAVESKRGLSCSVCGGRAMAENINPPRSKPIRVL